MTGLEEALDDITMRIDDLKDLSGDAPTALEEVNAIADQIVTWIEQRSTGDDSPDQVLRDVAKAAAEAHRAYTYAAALDCFDAGSVERDALTLIAGYWEMRKGSAELEASVVQERLTALDAGARRTESEEQPQGTTKQSPSPTLVTGAAKAGVPGAFRQDRKRPAPSEDKPAGDAHAVEDLAAAVARSSRSDRRPPGSDPQPSAISPSSGRGEGEAQDWFLKELAGHTDVNTRQTGTAPDVLERIRRLRAPTTDATTKKGPADGR